MQSNPKVVVTSMVILKETLVWSPLSTMGWQ